VFASVCLPCVCCGLFVNRCGLCVTVVVCVKCCGLCVNRCGLCVNRCGLFVNRCGLCVYRYSATPDAKRHVGSLVRACTGVHGGCGVGGGGGGCIRTTRSTLEQLPDVGSSAFESQNEDILSPRSSLSVSLCLVVACLCLCLCLCRTFQEIERVLS
jgi:hypothetical protein